MNLPAIQEGDAVEALETLGLRYIPTGSRVICDPPPTTTDRDFAAYVKPEHQAAVRRWLVCAGWEYSFYIEPERAIVEGWQSFRKGDDNIVLIWNYAIYAGFHHATKLATELNITHKEDRRLLFEAIRQMCLHYINNRPTRPSGWVLEAPEPKIECCDSPL